MSLELKTVVICEPRNKRHVKSALVALSCYDADWSGDNGKEHLRKEAKEAGYNNNADYFADKFVDALPNDYVKEAVRPVVESYVNAWMGHDSYYADYQVEVTEGTVGELIISLAYIDNE